MHSRFSLTVPWRYTHGVLIGTASFTQFLLVRASARPFIRSGEVAGSEERVPDPGNNYWGAVSLRNYAVMCGNDVD